MPAPVVEVKKNLESPELVIQVGEGGGIDGRHEIVLLSA
jgi:hypothetical protein